MPMTVVAAAVADVVDDFVSHGWWRKWNHVGLLVIER